MRISYLILSLLCVIGTRSMAAIIEATNGGQPLEVIPKKTVTTFWRITNPSPAPVRYAAELRLPPKWKTISGRADFELPAYGSIMPLWCWFVPQATLADTFQVTLLVHNVSDPTRVDSSSVSVMVLPLRKLDLKLAESPSLVIAGDAYFLSYLVCNESNISDSVHTILHYDNDNIPAQKGPTFWMSPGELKTVYVSLQTDPDVTKPANQGTSFSAQLGHDALTRKTSRSLIQVIPRMAEAVDPYHRLPMALTVSRVTQTGAMKNSGFQADFYIEGTLDEEQLQHVELHLKGPDIYNRSYFALHDEYYASYHSENLAVDAGDRLYSLSHLTESYRYGRGLSGQYRFGHWQAGAYWMKTRWLIVPEQQIGGQIDYVLNAQNKLGLNFLQKKVTSRTNDMISLAGQLQPGKNLHINLESAVGQTADQTKYAFNVDLMGNAPAVQYFLSYIYADPGFPGYYHDTQFVNVGASFRTIGALRFNFNLHRRDENIISDSTRFASPQTRENDIGMYYTWKNGSHAALSAIDHRSEDRLPVSTFDYREQKLRLLIGQSIDKFNYELALESGKTLNNIVDRMLPMERVTGFLTYSAGSRQSIRSFVSYSNDNRTSAQKQRQVTIGASARWMFGKKTYLAFEYQNKQDLEDYYRNRNMYQVDFSRTLFKSQQILVRGRRTLNSFSLQDKTTAWMVDYKIPFDIPIAKVKNRAAVTGTIINTATRQPVKDVMVQLNGLAIVTDRQGRFIFPALKPGHYYLTIECSNVGIQYVTDQKMPMELHLQDGDTFNLSIGVSESARLTGTLLLMPHHSGQTIVETDSITSANDSQFFLLGNRAGGSEPSDTSKGLANSAVQLCRDEETQWRTTDKDGRFFFEDLRPGHWTCKIYQNNIPDNYYLEKETFIVDLPAGSQKEIVIKALPKKRKIRMLDQQ